MGRAGGDGTSEDVVGMGSVPDGGPFVKVALDGVTISPFGAKGWMAVAAVSKSSDLFIALHFFLMSSCLMILLVDVEAFFFRSIEID